MRRLHAGFVVAGRYLLGDRIASRGMADVWEGTDQTLQRQVAVKVMRPDTDHEDLGLARMVHGDEEPDNEFTPLSRALLDQSPTMAADARELLGDD